MATKINTLVPIKDSSAAFRAVAELVEHLTSYNITIQTLLLANGKLTLNLSGDFPDDQVVHVGLEVV